VTSPGAGTPTGTVTFYSDGQSLGPATLVSNGTASLSSAALTVGTHAITAHYNGNGNFLGSTSDSLDQIVNPLTISVSATGLETSEDTAFSGTVPTFPCNDPSAIPGEFSLTIAWGDGQTSPGSVTATSNGFAVHGSHTYAEGGSFTYTVTI